MPTFQDLLAQIQGNGVPGQGNLLSTLAPMLGAGGPASAPTDNAFNSQIQGLIDQLAQPAPTTDLPVPPKSKLWQRILSGIADAGSVYAAGINPNVRPLHSLADILGRDEAGKNIAAGNVQRKKSAADEAMKKAAALKIQDLMRQRDEQTKNQERQSELNANVAARMADREDRQQEAKAAFDRSAALQRELEKQKTDTELAIAKIRESASAGVDKVEVRQKEKERRAAISQAKTAVINTKGQVPELLKAQTPEQIRESFTEMMDVLDLNGKDREEVLKYFMEKVDPMLQAHEKEQAAAETASKAREALNMLYVPGGQPPPMHGR